MDGLLRKRLEGQVDAQLLLLALLESRRAPDSEFYLSSLVADGYASHRFLVYEFINILIDRNIISAEVKNEPTGRSIEKDYVLKIIDCSHLCETQLAMELKQTISREIQCKPASFSCLESILLGSLAGEAHDYLRFYAKKNELKLVLDDKPFHLFRNMLTRCSLGQIHMVIWTSIKFLKRRIDQEVTNTHEFCSEFNKLYANYIRSSRRIEHYPRVRNSNVTIVSRLLIHDFLDLHNDHELVGAAQYFKKYQVGNQ